MPSKRYAWELAEARAWLKRERPKIYAGLAKSVRKNGHDFRERGRLIDSAVMKLMPWAFARAWDDIEAKAARIFGPLKQPQVTHKKARKIARNLH